MWLLFWFFAKVGSVLFGSGYVLLAFLRADLVERLRGEFVVVVGGAVQAPRGASIDTHALLKALLTELPPARAAKLAAKLSGEDRESLYALAESMKSP